MVAQRRETEPFLLQPGQQRLKDRGSPWVGPGPYPEVRKEDVSIL